MPADLLSQVSSWASIASLIVAIISLLLVRIIKANIIRFRRKQRLKELTSTFFGIGADAVPSDEFDCIFDALRRNFPVLPWSKLTKRGRLVIALHQRIDSRDLLGISEVLKDIKSYSEDI